MCMEQCLSTFCCVADKWKALLLASMLGTAITMVDIYSDIFVAIDFLYQNNFYWAAALVAIIVISNAFITREVIVVMKPESFITVFCVAILSMLGFGPVVLLCYLFFDGDDDHKNFFSKSYSQIEENMSIDPSSDAYDYFHKIISIRTHMAKIRAIESFCESMLSFSLQITYLITMDSTRVIYNKNWMLVISITISIFSFGSGLTKWVRNYARISAFHNKSLLKTKWYYNIFGTIYFCSDLAMRIIPFVLFYIWCERTENKTIFHVGIGALIVWEIICCRIAIRIWSMKYEISDSLMNPNGFLGGIFYCITCLFSSYYYMSQLPFNCLCGLIMLIRYIINSAAFIVFFMSINYSFTHSHWTLGYLSLYLLNVLTFLIWLFFKYHWLSSLAIEKGSKVEIHEPLLGNQSNNMKNGHNNNAASIVIPENEQEKIFDNQVNNSNSNNSSVNNYNNRQVNIKHNSNNNSLQYNNNIFNGYNNMNAYNSSIQMQSFNNNNVYRVNSQPIPSQYHIRPSQHMNMNSMSSINMNNNNRKMGSKSMQQMQLHNIGILSGYNPPIPKEQSVQQFNDYQFAMRLQQEQLYKAAQGKKVKKKENNEQNKNVNINNNNDIPSMDDVQKQQVIMQQQQRLMKQQINKMKNKNINKNRNDRNNTFEVLSDSAQLNDYNKQQSNSIKIQDMYNKQQKHVMADSYANEQNKKGLVFGNEDVGNNEQNENENGDDFDNDIIKNKQDTEELYGLHNNDINISKNNSLSPQPKYFNINNNKKSISNSLKKEGLIQQPQQIKYESSPESMHQSVMDSFDNSNNDNNSGKIIIMNKNLMVKSTEYNHQNWYNIFGKIVTQYNVQYHWKIKIKEFNNTWNIIIGILDSKYISKYQNVNLNENNKEYFAKNINGYGIDSNGTLKSQAQNQGKYCEPIKQNDIIDVYFDMQQYALWYGRNGNDFGVAYQVDSKSFYKLAISVFGPKHCVELISCDVVCYDEQNKNQSDVV